MCFVEGGRYHTIPVFGDVLPICTSASLLLYWKVDLRGIAIRYRRRVVLRVLSH
jgi:hypothetical protein